MQHYPLSDLVVAKGHLQLQEGVLEMPDDKADHDVVTSAEEMQVWLALFDWVLATLMRMGDVCTCKHARDACDLHMTEQPMLCKDIRESSMRLFSYCELLQRPCIL